MSTPELNIDEDWYKNGYSLEPLSYQYNSAVIRLTAYMTSKGTGVVETLYKAPSVEGDAEASYLLGIIDRWIDETRPFIPHISKHLPRY